MYVDEEGTPVLTLEEYRKLSKQQLRQLNDLQYGTAGGWAPYQDDETDLTYIRGRKIARAEYEADLVVVEDEAEQDEADRWLAENG